MARTAEVFFVGDAQSVIKAAKSAAAATDTAATSIARSNERVASSAVAAGKVAQESAAKWGASATRQAEVAGVAARKQAADAGASAKAQEAAYSKASAAAEAAAIRHQHASNQIVAAGKYAAVGLVAAGVGAVTMAVKFQTALERVHTQAGASQREVTKMSGAIRDLAGTVGVGPTKLAEGLYHVESAGLRGARALGVLKIAAEGAKVGGADLVDVTNALDAAVVSGIGGVQNFSQAMGALNATVGAGDMTMQNLADALGTGVLAPMKTYGLNIKDVGAALAVFGDNNIRGEDAATKLTSAVRIMAAPSAAASKALGLIGLSTLHLAKDMRSGGIVKALSDLKAHLKDSGATAEQQGLIIARAFGGRQSIGVQVLLSQLGRLKEKYGEVAQGSNKFGSAWGRVSHELGPQMEKLKAGAAGLADTIGLALIPVALKLVGAAQSVGHWFRENTVAAKALAVVVATVLGGAIATFVGARIASMVAGLNGMRLALMGVGTQAAATAGEVEAADTAIVTANEAAGASFMAMLGPIGAVAAAVAALNSIQPKGNKIQNLLGGNQPGEGQREGHTGAKGPGMFYAKQNNAGGIMAYFMAKGLTAAQASGIVGNIIQESSLNPKAPNGGLFQFEGSRAASGKGNEYQQLQAAWRELNGPYKSVLAELKKAKTPAEAARIFSGSAASGKGFERPGTPMMSNREAYAESVFKAHPQATEKNTHALNKLTGAVSHPKGIDMSSLAGGTHSAAHHAAAKAAAPPPNVTAWAEKMVGHYAENRGPNRGTELDKLEKEFGMQAQSWCAMFATTAAAMGGANKAVKTASVETIRTWAEQGSHGFRKGVSRRPERGSLMMFGDKHVAFVTGVHGGMVSTVEGNANGSGGVIRSTHRIGEGDYAMPKYPADVKSMSKSWDFLIKGESQKRASDEKAAKAELSKMLAAINTGELSKMTKFVDSAHERHLAELGARLHGDHSAALDKLDRQLLAAHRGVLEAMRAAVAATMAKWQEAADSVKEKLSDLVGSVGSAWESAQAKALKNSPEAAAIRGKHAEAEAEADRRTEIENGKALEEAKKKLGEGRVNENPLEIKEGQEAVARAEEAITAFAREQDTKRRETKLQTEEEGLEAGRLAYEATLGAQFSALQANLAASKISYQAFASEVQKILAATGLGIEYRPDAAVGSAQPYVQQEFTAPGEGGYGGGFVRVGGRRASGGMMYPGILYRVGETGPETVTPSVPSMVGQASQGASSGAQAHFHGDVYMGSRRDADRLAMKIAHNLRNGGRH